MNDANARFGTDAKIIKDSVSEYGYRVTTMEVTIHRFVLAELNTHRDFSRNSASSRAIPFRKQVERIQTSPAIPVEWRAEQKGMQGGDILERAIAKESEKHWLEARDNAVKAARSLNALGVHKSIVNRLMEPFMWHTVIITSTNWDNFFKQRVSPLAQPEIRVAAEMMLEAYENSVPEEIEHGWWHLPYIDEEADSLALEQYYHDQDIDPWTQVEGLEGLEVLKQVSAARCARVSYLTHDGKRDIAKDVELYERLTSADPMHASPLEHVCTPASYAEVRACEVRGNLLGWYQLRHMVEDERAVEQFDDLMSGNTVPASLNASESVLRRDNIDRG